MGSLNFNSEKERIADQFGYDSFIYQKSNRMKKGLLNKITEFVKKHWLIISALFAVLILTGAVKRFFGRAGMKIALNNAEQAANNPELIDYGFLAISIRAAIGHGFFSFKWGTDESEIVGYINSLPSMNSFLNLCRTYVSKYGNDLRAELREHFTDKDYSKLKWK